MNDINELQQAEFYTKELTTTKISIDALIKLLEHNQNHPQYDQLNYLKERSEEIKSQLSQLNEIQNKFKDKK